MANRAIINKHIDSLENVNILDLFVDDPEKAKGEIVIVNGPTTPSIYVLGPNGPQAVVGGSNGGNGGSGNDQDIQAIQGTLVDHENRLDVIEPVVTGHTQDIQSIKDLLKSIGDNTGSTPAIAIDKELNGESENAIANKAVATAVSGIQDRLLALEEKPDVILPKNLSDFVNDTNFITLEDIPEADDKTSLESTNPIQNKVITQIIQDNEKTVSDALTDIDKRLVSIESTQSPYKLDLSSVEDEEKGPVIYSEVENAYKNGLQFVAFENGEEESTTYPVQIHKTADGTYVFTIGKNSATKTGVNIETATYLLTPTVLSVGDDFSMTLSKNVKEEGEALLYLADDGTYHEIVTGSNITVDEALNPESENPVQNKAVANAITGLTSRIGTLETYDTTNTVTIQALQKSVTDTGSALGELTKTVSGHTGAIQTLNDGMQGVDGKISTAVNTAKETIDLYTVNGVKVSENPVLNAASISIDNDYTSENSVADPITPGDTVSVAFGKIEKNISNNSLVFSAALNDLNAKTGAFKCPFWNGDSWEPSFDDDFDYQAFYNSALSALKDNRIFVVTDNAGAYEYQVADAVILQDETVSVTFKLTECDAQKATIGTFRYLITPTSVTLENPAWFNLSKDGDGSMFLNDKGEYVTVNTTNAEPVSVEYGVAYYDAVGDVSVENVSSHTHHVFTGALTSLTVTLGNGGKIGGQEYIIEFDTTEVVPTVSIAYPNFEVIWPTVSGITYEPNMHYIVSVQRGYGMVQSFEAVDRKPENVE